MTIDGKKKFIATISSLVVAVLGALATNGVIGGETADMVTQLSAILVPLGVGLVYNIMQGIQDKKKEETKQVEAQAATAQAQANNTSKQVVAYVEEKLIEPFDAAAFDEKVKKFAVSEYGESTKFTELKAAISLGKKRVIEDIQQAIDYWAYIYNKQDAVFVEKFGFNYADSGDKDNLRKAKDGQSCTYPDIGTMAVDIGIDAKSILTDIEDTQSIRNYLRAVKEDKVNWRRLAEQSYYYIGERAYILFMQPSDR